MKATANELIEIIENEGEDNLVNALDGAIQEGANPAFVNDYGDTPLHVLINCSGEESILEKAAEIIINAEKTNINAQDREGKTPLHLAIEAKYNTLARLLINYQASVLTKDNEGKTPKDRAENETNRDENLIEILERVETQQKITQRFKTTKSARNCGKRSRADAAQTWQERIEDDEPQNKKERSDSFVPSP